MSKSSYLKKLIFFIRPSTVFTVFKIINFILKIFGLYPFKIERTKNDTKTVICLSGVILTTVHIITYFYGYLKVHNIFCSKIGHSSEIYKTNIFTIIDIFGAHLLLVLEGVTVFSLFLNVPVTMKAQRSMTSLFNQAEIKLKDEGLYYHFCCGLDLLKLFAFSFLLFLNLLGSFWVSVIILFDAFNESANVYFAFARILPHLYIYLKTTQFVLYTLMFHLMFNALNNVMLLK